MADNTQHSTEPVKVTRAVAEGIREVRDSGMTNMFDKRYVIRLLEQWGHDEAAAWVRASTSQYFQLIMYGLEVIDN